jgi:hypothetical protein
LEHLENREVPASVTSAPVISHPAIGPAVALSTTQDALTVSRQTGFVDAAEQLALAGLGGTPFAATPANGTLPFGPATLGIPNQSSSFLSSQSLGLNEAAGASANISSLLFTNSDFLAAIGAPNPIRINPVSPAVPGAGASVAANPTYVTEGVSLTGGGGPPAEFRSLPPADWDPDHPQTRTEASAAGASDPDSSAWTRDQLFESISESSSSFAIQLT